jgi:hypothetical protein
MTHTLPKYALLAALVLGAVLVATSSTAQAAAPAATFETANPSTGVVLASLEGFKNWLKAQVFATFSYRERMIQMMAVGLFIGLFVMLRKMPGQT